jgi:hopanoid biosynthesis associated protein HpnK
VNADDFGRSASINAAVIRAHREGILTTASLMVNESACSEAVALARENPQLGVGLHLTLVCGHAALPHSLISGLVNAQGEFSNQAVAAGWKYFFRRDLREQLRAEIRAQIEKFKATGLRLDHVNGHLHFHLHPTVFDLVVDEIACIGGAAVRLPYDPFWLNLRLASGHWFYRTAHAGIFLCLAGRARPVLKRRGWRYTQAVFGLLQNARVDETYVARLLPRLPAGDSELYSHPSLDEFTNEFEALVSPQVREQITRLGIQLIRYQDL